MGLALPIYADPANYLDMSYKMSLALTLSENEKLAKIAKQLEQASGFTWHATAVNTLNVIRSA
mgnify:CR=1 FL=1